ncbi:MAG: HD domain-containing protein [Pseudobutyrivibrio sp.]|nr:HD domain-containing protein [Pseudobutyrivibrio sp.]
MANIIQEFVDRFTGNFTRVRDLDQSFADSGENFHEWELGVLTRSAEMRLIFQDNEKLFEEVKEYMSQELDDDTALEIYHAIESLYLGCYDDLVVMRLICTPVLEYYKKKKDYDKVILLTAALGFENYDFFGRMLGGEEYIHISVEYYKQIVELANLYSQITEQSSRVRILTAYGNLISPLGMFDPESHNTVFDYYNAALKLYDTTARAMDGDVLDGIMHLMDASILDYECRIPKFSKETLAEFSDVVERLERENCFLDDGGELFRARMKLDVYNGKKDVLQAIEEIIDYINNIEEPDYESIEDEYLEGYINNAYKCGINIFELYDLYDVPDEKRREYTPKFVASVTRKLVRVPYKIMTTSVSQACSIWFTNAIKRLYSYEDKRQFLMHMILCRQPYTYIHSRMVQTLAMTIAGNMLANDNHYFDTVKLREGENLQDYISEAAFLHDIGKCAIAEVINKQSRKLDDIEFTIIKKHPELALEVVGNDEDFMAYADVILGHHKTYDGKGGYPASFDNRASTVAPVIDLISICDAMDAATDVYGRNYHPGKNFDTLYEELVRGKGSRYCPEIVDFIGENKDLYSALKDLTENCRGEIYYSVHRELEMIKKNEK